jgi:hypothetical protein
MFRKVIPLRPRQPATSPPAPGADTFTELTRVRDQAEAVIVRGLLEAHGVRVALRTHVAPSVHPFSVGDQAEVRVLVPAEALGRSRRLLARRPAPVRRPR